MTTYKVRARRWEHGWELHISDVGVTQSHRLTEAERLVRDYLRLEFDKKEADRARVEITVDLDGLENDVAALRAELAELTQTQRSVAEHSRRLVRTLRARGLTGADTAIVLGISPQRVSQLAK